MAYVLDPSQMYSGAQQGAGAGPVLSGASGSGSGPAPGKATPNSSGQFTNLQSYLNANQEQGAQMGQDVIGNVGNQAQKAQNEADNTASAFKSDVDKGTVQNNQDFINQTLANAPTAVKDQGTVDKFTQMRDASYGGPSDVTQRSEYGQTQQDLSNAQSAVDQTKSESGRTALLQNQYGRPNYSRGEQALDQLIVQNNPGAREAFQGVQDKYAGLNNYLTNQQDNLNQYAQQGKDQTQQTHDQTQASIQQAQGDFQKQLQQQLADYQQAQTDKAAMYSRDIANHDVLSQDTMNALGLKQGQQLFNIDLNQYAPNYSPNTATIQNTAGADQFARANALAQLSGNANTVLTDPSQAGTAQGVKLNAAGLQQALQQQQNQYDQQHKSAVDLMSQLDMSRNQADRLLGENGQDRSQQESVMHDAMLQNTAELAQAADAAGYQNTGAAGMASNALRTQALLAYQAEIQRAAQRSAQFNQLQDVLKQYDASNPGRTVQLRS